MPMSDGGWPSPWFNQIYARLTETADRMGRLADGLVDKDSGRDLSLVPGELGGSPTDAQATRPEETL